MPINVEEELNNLQSQIDVLTECCATCGLNGGIDTFTLFFTVWLIGVVVLLGFCMGKLRK